jgi:hypothetical protein
MDAKQAVMTEASPLIRSTRVVDAGLASRMVPLRP